MVEKYSVRLREYTDQKKLRIWTLFTQCEFPSRVVIPVKNDHQTLIKK